MKPVRFCGDSLKELRRFPDAARREAGHQVQRGMEPSDWKPMPTVGAGVSEIRIKDERGIYRVLRDEVSRCHLCAALLSEEDAKNERGRP